ncbi:hypothetical protein [Brunnivagina elsteri]|uniref:Uncharacterized protein n=1 Tax=Brunnivagina elsteri CCALA 953 TaxID=987040 RepID=A0A2A2TPK9_9CYAN|nr:hypothetical protein [Calothrix elsteri]PAX60294.1 hypothetical protein CK510_02630 [Calothrix elsteri CCALA 953]
MYFYIIPKLFTQKLGFSENDKTLNNSFGNIPQSRKTHPKSNYSGSGTVCDRTINQSQIQLFRSRNSLRKHYKPTSNPTIPKLQQFAIALSNQSQI